MIVSVSIHIVVVAVALEAAEVGDVGVGGGLALQLGLRLLLGRVDLALAGAFVEREGVPASCQMPNIGQKPTPTTSSQSPLRV